MELVGHQHGGVKVDGVVDGGEDPQGHELLDDLGGGDLQPQGELAHGDLLRHLDGDVLGLALLGDALQALGLGLPLAPALLAPSLLVPVGELLLVHHVVGLHLLVRQPVVLLVVPVDVHVGRSGVNDPPHGLLGLFGRLGLGRLGLLGLGGGSGLRLRLWTLRTCRESLPWRM